MTKLLEGKKGLIVGIANTMSISYAIAKEARNHGAEILLTYQSDELEKRILPICEELDVKFVKKMNVAEEDSVANLAKEIEAYCGKIDFIVHGVGFSDKDELRGRYIDTSLKNFLNTMNISCFSLTSLVKNLENVLNDNSSILTLSYLGSQKVIPNYNVMGLAKAALETSVKYIANDLGVRGIRANAISAGPIRTLASSGISGIRSMIKSSAEMSPLKRSTTQEDVAKSALYFLSDLSCGVTSEIHYVDCGYSSIGVISEGN